MHETRLNLLNQQLKEILNGHCILRQIGRNLFFGVKKLDVLKINHRFRGILGEESSLSFARITPYAVQHKYSSPSGGRIKFIRFFNAEPYYWLLLSARCRESSFQIMSVHWFTVLWILLQTALSVVAIAEGSHA